MESFFSRFRNLIALAIVLVAQIVALAAQVRRPVDPQHPDAGSVRLARVWVVGAITPFEKMFSAIGHGIRGTWSGYIDLRGARRENAELKDEIEKMRLEQVRLSEDASQARRLQALLAFKEQYIASTVAAQVIGSSGTERSRTLFIDKGSSDGVAVDMPVITADGIVGKISRVYNGTAQVLLISDALSGAGVMLGNSRLRGTLNGTGSPYPEVHGIMADEKVEKGEQVFTSGGDQVYPRGLPVGTVANVGNDTSGDPFLLIKVKPAADLNRLEEVLVITHIDQKQAETADEGPRRAADILAERLPTVKPNEGKVSDDPPSTAALYGPGAKKKSEEPPDTRTLYANDARKAAAAAKAAASGTTPTSATPSGNAANPGAKPNASTSTTAPKSGASTAPKSTASPAATNATPGTQPKKPAPKPQAPPSTTPQTPPPAQEPH